MASLAERILALLRSTPGLTDRELTDRLLGSGVAQQGVNHIARSLAAEHVIARRARHDGKLGNYPAEVALAPPVLAEGSAVLQAMDPLSEDDVKRKLQAWLEGAGWKVSVAWGRGHGVDIDALQADHRWVIEAKGRGSLDPMRVNYFLGVLGELLQRMNDPAAQYSIALPDLPQFRRLWDRLPELAKQRTGISAIFVNDSGGVEEVLAKCPMVKTRTAAAQRARVARHPASDRNVRPMANVMTKPDAVERLFTELRFDRDVRRPPDDKRRVQFQMGWGDATVRQREYSESILRRLTWHNLGYRFGRNQGPQPVEAIDTVYRVLARAYGTLWVPRSPEDHLLRSYWRQASGRLYVEVPIGAASGPGSWPTQSTRRRLDAVRFPDASDPAIVRFSAAEFQERVGLLRVELIEAKPSLNRAAIGQVIAGRDMFRRNYGVSVHRSVVICGAGDGALEWVCSEHDIEVEVIGRPQ